MTESAIKVVVTRAKNLEFALSALTNIISDATYPQDVRRAAQIAHKYLHACRAPETVQRMERERGLAQ